MLKKLSALTLFSFSCFAMEVGPALQKEAALSGAKDTKVFARAQMERKSNSNATGDAIFSTTKDGNLLVTVFVRDVSPGRHGIHIHEFGDCSDPKAENAGQHFNPTREKHGGPLSTRRHAGDLGNISVADNGMGQLSVEIDKAEARAMGGWDKIIGKSLVLHAHEDDLKSQPSGDSGDRIACGTIEKSDTPAVAD